MNEKNLSLIFDLDGTLWDSTDTIYKIWGKEFNISKAEFDSLMGKTNNEIISLLEIDEDKLNKIQVKENEILIKEGAKLYPNVIETIKKLAKKHSLFIVSNCQKGYIEAFLDYYDLNNCFKDIECSGNTKKDKKINLRRIVKRNKICNAIFIGDTKSDLKAANYVKLPFINVKYGFGNLNAKPAIYNIKEIFTAIDEICNNGMEYRDLYNKNKINTYERTIKGKQIPQNRYYITVVIFIENSKNELFLQVNKKYNLWSITGGHPKSGENSLEGAITELSEELSLKVNSKKLSLIKSIKTDDDFVDIYYLKSDFAINDIKCQVEEVGDVNWFTNKEIDKLIKNNKLIPTHVDFYKEFLKYKNKALKNG